MSARQVEDLAELIHAALSATYAAGMADADDIAALRVVGVTSAEVAAASTAASRELWTALYDLRAAP